MEEYWELEVENWENISFPFAEKCLALAEETHEHLRSVSNSITNRSYTLLTVYVVFISTLVAVINSDSVLLSLPLWMLIVMLVLFVGSFICFMILIGPRLTSTPGRIPKDLDPYDRYIELGTTEDKDLSYLALILSQIENTQAQIEFLEKSNKKRLKIFLSGMAAEGSMFLLFFIFLLASV